MSNLFEGKNVLVTGSTKGIGLEIAKNFTREGSNTIINSRNEEDCKKISKQLNNSIYVSGDVSETESAKRVVEYSLKKLESLDIVICNAGNSSSSVPGKEKLSDWDMMLNDNLFSAINIINFAKPYLEISKGCIVCISSICGNNVIKGAPITYSVSKAALNAYIRGMATPLGEKGIRINGIAPGNILFEGSVWERRLEKQKEDTEAMIANEVPLNRFGSTLDIASAVSFLCSEESNFITGSVLNIDGGQASF